MLPVFIVHGGAGDIPDSRVSAKLEGVKTAARLGFKILIQGGGPVAAVEAAVRTMEDDPAFNAGYGSVLNIEGEVEMDASIMVGADFSAGAVTVVKDIAHPISLACMVMERTPHVLLAAHGATQFAKEQGVPILPPGSLVTEQAKEALEDFKKKGGLLTEIGAAAENKGDVGTVGAVAVDGNGFVAAATSTGGINGKMVGRCSDSSQLGSGTFADNAIGGVSTTGHGESIMRFSLAHAIIKAMEKGDSSMTATVDSVAAMTEKLDNAAGAVTVSKEGDVGFSFTSKRMAWAYMEGEQLHYGIEQGQHEIEKVNPRA